MSRVFLMLAVGIMITTSGCSLPVVDLHESVTFYKLAFREQLAAQSEVADEFLACSKQPYDERGTILRGTAKPETPANPVRGDEGLSPVHALVARIKENDRSQGKSLAALEDVVNDLTGQSRQHIDLVKLQRVVDVIDRWHGHLAFDEDELSSDGSRFAQLLLAYNKAYFGDITFTGEPTVSGEGIRAVTKTTSSGFTDRIGNTWVFPGLSVAVAKEPGKAVRFAASPVDSQRLSADLVRLFLEAFFDAAFREPAVGGATALQIEWKGEQTPYPPFDADHPPIPLEAFARITRDALRAEAVTISLVGKAVRGGSIFSIQNETVAATLETAAGVIAKKLVEHDGFCYYQVMKNTK